VAIKNKQSRESGNIDVVESIINHHNTLLMHNRQDKRHKSII